MRHRAEQASRYFSENAAQWDEIRALHIADSEVEPWLDVNPTDPDNLVAFWQQDRWSNGGSRGNVAAVSLNGGQTWTIVPVPGQTDCTGGPFEVETEWGIFEEVYCAGNDATLRFLEQGEPELVLGGARRRWSWKRSA